MVQRTFVQIARGLSPGAKVMLIDEPTAPMDDAEVVQFLSVLRALTREGMGIVYISHRLKEIFQLANRIDVLRDGKLVAELSGDEMTYQRVISAMVGGKSLKERAAVETQRGPGPAQRREPGREGHPRRLAPAARWRDPRRLRDQRIRARGPRARRSSVPSRARARVEIDGRKASASVADSVTKGLGYMPPERRTQGLDLDASVAANMTTAILKR